MEEDSLARYWLVVGSPENWKTAFEHNNIWGLKESQSRLWDSLQEDDRLLFYATSPVVGLIGYGTVSTKFRQNHPLWPQELKEAKVIWPLRFEFDVRYCLPPGEWKERRIVSKDLWPRGGFQPLGEQLGEQLISSFEEADSTIPLSEPSGLADVLTELKPISADPEEVLLSHDDLKEALVQIGRLQKFIAESEYQFDIGRLDVVWRRVEKSVPTYVFEVQIGGNLTSENVRRLLRWKDTLRLTDTVMSGSCIGQKNKKVTGVLSSLKDINRFRNRRIGERKFFEITGKVFSYGIVWRVFLLHMARPSEYPILDNNVIRATSVLTGKEPEDTWEGYLSYRHFFFKLAKAARIVTSKPTGREKNTKEIITDLKKIDDALFAFGEFLATYDE